MKIDLTKYKDNLLFIPLGGAGEIGMNVNLYHLDGKWLMVDLGLGFAHNAPGIDMLAPDISFIKSNKKDLVGLILTHIHEDHLGAVQYLWEELEVPIYTSNLTAIFLRSKLEEYSFAKYVKINVIDPNKELALNPFKINFIGLTHSVPEMNALIIKTKYGNILHSGDWKFDTDPVVGDISQKDIIREYGNQKSILALVCDSTNALNPGRSGSEGDLFDSLKKIISKCKKRVCVTTFASNIARIYTIADVARSCGRKVALSGFSLKRITEAGKKAGYFDNLEDFISEKEVNLYKKDEVLVLSTGCQGEPLASTMKIANDVHKSIKFGKGDTVIFSSKIIPGNEKSIFRLFNLFAKKQIEVITEKDDFVHVSGHPNQDELREMYDLAKPQISIPVHGEFVHMKQHCKIALEQGVKDTIQVENGSIVKLLQDDSEIIGQVPTGYFGVDGSQLVPMDGDIIRIRNKLQNAGIVVVGVFLNKSYKLLGFPHLSSFGTYDFSSDKDSLRTIKNKISKEVAITVKDLGLDKGLKEKIFNKNKKKKLNQDKIISVIDKKVRTIINKSFRELINKKPLIDVIIKVI